MPERWGRWITRTSVGVTAACFIYLATQQVCHAKRVAELEQQLHEIRERVDHIDLSGMKDEKDKRELLETLKEIQERLRDR